MSDFSHVYLMSRTNTVRIPMVDLCQWWAMHKNISLTGAEADLSDLSVALPRFIGELQLGLKAGAILVEAKYKACYSLVEPKLLEKTPYFLVGRVPVDSAASGNTGLWASFPSFKIA